MTNREHYFLKCRELEKENEQLKFQLKECREHKLFSRRELETENEQLKQQVKQLQHWNKCLAEKRHQELKGDCE